MEDSIAEEAQARNQKKKKDKILQIVKLEYIEDSEDTKEDEKYTTPIPG